MSLGAFVVLVIILLCGLPLSETGDCPKPTLTVREYTISNEASSYIAGSEFKVICQFGYKNAEIGLLVCQSSGHWSGSKPTCEEYYPDMFLPWWSLLILIFIGITVLTCLSPRIWIWIKNHKHRAAVRPATADVKQKDFSYEKFENPIHKPWYMTNKVKHGIPLEDLPSVMAKRIPLPSIFYPAAIDNLSF